MLLKLGWGAHPLKERFTLTWQRVCTQDLLVLLACAPSSCVCALAGTSRSKAGKLKAKEKRGCYTLLTKAQLSSVPCCSCPYLSCYLELSTYTALQSAGRQARGPICAAKDEGGPWPAGGLLGFHAAALQRSHSKRLERTLVELASAELPPFQLAPFCLSTSEEDRGKQSETGDSLRRPQVRGQHSLGRSKIQGACPLASAGDTVSVLRVLQGPAERSSCLSDGHLLHAQRA